MRMGLCLNEGKRVEQYYGARMFSVFR